MHYRPADGGVPEVACFDAHADGRHRHHGGTLVPAQALDPPMTGVQAAGAVAVTARAPGRSASRAHREPPSFGTALTAAASTLTPAEAARLVTGLGLRAAAVLGAGLAALASLLALAGDDPGTTGRLIRFVEAIGPDGAASAIQGAVAEAMRSDGIAAVSFAASCAAAFWLASRYLRAFRRALPAIGGPPERERPRPRALSVLLLPGCAALIAAIAGALVLTGPAARAAVEALGGGERALALWSVGKWPLIAAAFVPVFLLLHGLARPRAAGVRSIAGGRVLAIALWALVLGAFAFYLANFDSFERTYGGGAAIVSLLWLALLTTLYFATPSLAVDRFGTVLPGLAVALAGLLGASAGLAACAAVLDPFRDLYGALGLGALSLGWLAAANGAVLLGAAVDLELERRLRPPAPVSAPDGVALEEIVRTALGDDTAHREMWNVLPGAPGAVPGLLSALECDLNDWGFAYGVAWAAAKQRYPAASDEEIAARALQAARAVFDEYCAGEDWSGGLEDRRAPAGLGAAR